MGRDGMDKTKVIADSFYNTRVACYAACVYSGAETMRATSFTRRLFAIGDDMCQLSQASRLFQQASHVSTTHQIHVRGQELLPSFIVACEIVPMLHVYPTGLPRNC